jgi:hypothetical protein
MADEDTFDIYGDDDLISPSSPSQQSGPKKRLRRERSSSAPPLSKSASNGDEENGSPRGKKIKEEDNRDEETKAGTALKLEEEGEEEEDPFREYDNHVFTRSTGKDIPLLSIILLWLRWFVCIKTLIYSIITILQRMLLLRDQEASLRRDLRNRSNHPRQRRCTSVTCIG